MAAPVGVPAGKTEYLLLDNGVWVDVGMGLRKKKDRPLVSFKLISLIHFCLIFKWAASIDPENDACHYKSALWGCID